MKCYVHRDVDAIGVCSRCGQGVCDSCAVRIGGKLYCKSDADRVFSAQEAKATPTERPMRAQVAAVFFFLYGAFGIGLGILFVLAGFVSGLFASLPFYGSLEVASLGALGFGGLLLTMGIVGIICGIWLWRVQVWGSAVGVPLLIIGMIIPLFFLAAAPSLFTYELFSAIWVVNGVLLALVVASWAWIRSLSQSALLAM